MNDIPAMQGDSFSVLERQQSATFWPNSSTSIVPRVVRSSKQTEAPVGEQTLGKGGKINTTNNILGQGNNHEKSYQILYSLTLFLIVYINTTIDTEATTKKQIVQDETNTCNSSGQRKNKGSRL